MRFGVDVYEITFIDDFIGYFLLLIRGLSVELTDDLIPIALKVLHPGIRQQIKSDLDVLNTLAYIGETLIPPLQYLNIVDCVKEFSASMREQVGSIYVYLFVGLCKVLNKMSAIVVPRYCYTFNKILSLCDKFLCGNCPPNVNGREDNSVNV